MLIVIARSRLIHLKVKTFLVLTCKLLLIDQFLISWIFYSDDDFRYDDFNFTFNDVGFEPSIDPNHH
jgi:hypothetical protein